MHRRHLAGLPDGQPFAPQRNRRGVSISSAWPLMCSAWRLIRRHDIS